MTTLIKNVQLIDGSGRSPYKADVLIKRKRISAIGHFSRYIANAMIDGRGAYLAPGFIDVHSSVDRYLSLFPGVAHDSSAVNLLLQGVTTAIIGQDGISLSPLIYGSLGFLEEWVDVKKINVNWHSLGEFLSNLKRFPLPINLGTMVGYRTIRQSITGHPSRPLSVNEIKILKLLLEKSLKEGAFGLSTGPRDLKTELHFSEIKGILDILAKHKGVYAQELYGTTEEKLALFRLITNLVEESGVKTLINHLEPAKSSTAEHESILESIHSASARADITFEVYFSDFRVSPAYELLPDWFINNHQLSNGEMDAILRRLKNEPERKRLRDEFPKIKGGDIIIVSAPEHKYLEGKLLGDFSKNRRLTLGEGLLKLIELTKGRVIVSHQDIKRESFRKGLERNQSVIASADLHLKEVPTKTFVKFLDLIEKKEIIPIETAVHKMTGMPADKFGLKNRGLVKAGYIADLTLFKDGEVRDVIISGIHAVSQERIQSKKAGEVLEHKA